MMVRFCCVPNCSNRSDRESNLSYFGLRLKNTPLLKQWVHIIRQKNFLLNNNTKIVANTLLMVEVNVFTLMKSLLCFFRLFQELKAER